MTNKAPPSSFFANFCWVCACKIVILTAVGDALEMFLVLLPLGLWPCGQAFDGALLPNACSSRQHRLRTSACDTVGTHEPERCCFCLLLCSAAEAPANQQFSERPVQAQTAHPLVREGVVCFFLLAPRVVLFFAVCAGRGVCFFCCRSCR